MTAPEKASITNLAQCNELVALVLFDKTPVRFAVHSFRLWGNAAECIIYFQVAR